MAASAVTPTGVRDGDPDALAAVCEARGPAVLAYCEVVAGRGPAGAAAAADAFGSFRAGVVATADLSHLKPEALLISATRHAAARYAGADLPPTCSRVPALLAARADRSITLADHDVLEQHLGGCWTCRAPVARFEAADRAYLDPPRALLEPAIAAEIVAAMTAAAPVRGTTVDVPAVLADQAAPSINGHGAHADRGVHDLPATYEAEPLDQPTSSYEMPAADLADADPPADEPRRDPPEPGRRRSILGALGFGRQAPDAAAGSSPATPVAARGPRVRRVIRAGGGPTPATAPRPRRIIRGAGARTAAGAGLAAGSPATTDAAADSAATTDAAADSAATTDAAAGSAATTDAAAGSAATTGAGGGAAGAAGAAAATGSGAAAGATPRTAAGLNLPRPRPRRAVASSAGGRGALRLALLLPIVLVLFAIIAALAIAGVFDGGEPVSTPQSLAPETSEPAATTTTPPVVVVPGAGDASAADVERAKARARAASRRTAATTPATPATAAPPPAGTITPPPATGAAAPPPPPPPPPPATKAKPTGKGSAGTPKIDADNGATGAEQVPAPDTSTVPELAPPVEPVDP